LAATGATPMTLTNSARMRAFPPVMPAPISMYLYRSGVMPILRSNRVISLLVRGPISYNILKHIY
jgi:hypothetical protein